MKLEVGRKRLYNSTYKEKFGREDVVHWDAIPIKTEQELLLEFVSTNSSYLQGIRLAIDAGEGTLEVNGIKARGMEFWEDTCPPKALIKCTSSEGLLSVYNLLHLGRTPRDIRSLTGSFGMLVEQHANEYTYRCNSYSFDGDFDHLVFRITLL